MSNLNKVLTVVFAILIIIVIAEAGIFLNQNQKTSRLSSSPTPSITSSLSPTVSQSSPPANLVINNRTFYNLTQTKKELTRQYEGKVVDINTKGESLRNFASASGTVTYAVILRIQGTNKIPYQLYYTKEELQKTKASFENIKIGDTVRIEETVDLSLLPSRLVTKLLVNKL